MIFLQSNNYVQKFYLMIMMLIQQLNDKWTQQLILHANNFSNNHSMTWNVILHSLRCRKYISHWWIFQTNQQSWGVLMYSFVISLNKLLNKHHVSGDLRCHGTHVTSHGWPRYLLDWAMLSNSCHISTLETIKDESKLCLTNDKLQCLT